MLETKPETSYVEKMNMINIMSIVLLWSNWLVLVCGGRYDLASPSSSPTPALAPHMNPLLPFNGGACTGWVHQYGYQCEEHKVTTKDGYTLSMQRIPRGLKNTSFKDVKPPILLQHGVFVDGMCFMFIGRESLAFYLADQGFDVWVANSRGTQQSLNHTFLHSSQKEFWNWSVDDLVEYDFAATVDYVHSKTSQKAHYVAHSMGSLIGLSALASNVPAVTNLRSASFLSPIAYLNHIFSPFALLAANLFLAETGELIGLPFFDPAGRHAAEMSQQVCNIHGVDCSYLFTAFTGPNCCLTNTGVEIYLSHTQLSSMKLLVHLSQNVRGGGPRKFDFGAVENQKRYGSIYPPKYDMSKIPKYLPMFISHGGRDSLSDFVDVSLLLNKMKDHDQNKLVTSYHVDYAHVDFLMATNVVDTVYNPLVSFLKSN